MDWNRLFQLKCGIRHNVWGGRKQNGQLPYIADLLGHEDCEDLPYAELWIGAHRDLPARVLGIDGEPDFDDLIGRCPEPVLGSELVSAGWTSLPFLLKVLNCDRPLSIQAHPDLELARQLHARDPEHYPDANHKPEIAVAVTPFRAMCQFREATAIRADLARWPSLARFFSMAPQAPSGDDCQWLRQTYRRVFDAPESKVADVLRDLPAEVRRCDSPTPEDVCLLELLEHFPHDKGVLSAYFLNSVTLQPGEALFLKPNEPHAYMHGTIVECMANSDNVVRAGLTPRYIDQDVLLEMLSYQGGAIETVTGVEDRDGDVVYPTPVPEFRVEVWRHERGFRKRCSSGDAVSVFVVLEGAVEVHLPAGDRIVCERGTTWLWPGSLEQVDVAFIESDSQVVRARPNV